MSSDEEHEDVSHVKGSGSSKSRKKRRIGRACDLCRQKKGTVTTVVPERNETDTLQYDVSRYRRFDDMFAAAETNMRTKAMASRGPANAVQTVLPTTMNALIFARHPRRVAFACIFSAGDLHAWPAQRRSRPKGYTEQLEKRLAKMEEMLATV